MEDWSTSSKVGLTAACCAVFATVLLVAGRKVPAASPAQAHLPAALEASPVPAFPQHEARPAEAALENPAPSASAPALDDASVAELERQAMPMEETTAEENEQRGDVLRRLRASENPAAVPALVYALRNDVDIRNRILAIDGLRRAALAENRDRAIVDALAEASRSGDEVIASQASQALAEIEERHRAR
jgi:hypothetical protein